MGVNNVTGDYFAWRRRVSGSKNGKLAYPVSEITVAGNLKGHVSRASHAPPTILVFRHGTDAPTLRIEGMTIAGE